MDKIMVIRFKGTKAELLNHFKSLCALKGKSMTARVIEMIEEETKK